ncbi:MAG: metallophosphoesterase [Cytophagales bacterium]|nr:metallophosphoesterase [Cytophagales bacterium]
MKIARRKFLKGFTLTSAYLLAGGYQSLSATEVFGKQKKVVLRIAVGSDSHYGQPDTEFDQYIREFVAHINTFHKKLPIQACVLNGDLIHDQPDLMAQLKPQVEKLLVPYYVTQGNHDRVSAQHWQQIWNVPLNYEKIFGNNVLIMMSTSNEKGEYLSPDLEWLGNKLRQHQKKNVFLFLHIGQQKWTTNSIDNPAYADLLPKHSNVKAVFHGHDHDQDGEKMLGNTPHLYDSHIGGSWGTPYKGFRIVEVLKDNSVQTYMMNPVSEINRAEY